MPEFRQETLSGSWVLMAESRAARPQELGEQPLRPTQSRCPFCRGHESETPQATAVFTLRERPDQWQVRCIPNKYPAVQTETGGGIHEVIVESPEHLRSWTELTVEQRRLVLHAYRDRLQAARAMRRWSYGLIFKNFGAAAGASLEHVHSQMLATSILPEKIVREMITSQQHGKLHRRTLLSDLLAKELQDQQRIVAATEHHVVFCPYASRAAYECWIVPRKAQACFEDADDVQLGDLARVAGLVLEQLERILQPAAYNLLLHTAPFDTLSCEHYHWRIEILPRITKLAGFEWATGCFINAVYPEEAARRLATAGAVGSGAGDFSN